VLNHLSIIHVGNGSLGFARPKTKLDKVAFKCQLQKRELTE